MRLLFAALSLTGCANAGQSSLIAAGAPAAGGQRAVLPGVGDGNPGREGDQRIYRPSEGQAFVRSQLRWQVPVLLPGDMADRWRPQFLVASVNVAFSWSMQGYPVIIRS
jgi:hypothetical protein